MNPDDIDRLRSLTSFPDLVAYLRDELDWPIELEDAEDIVFDYHPAELGIDPQHAVKIESIKQLRPLVDNQPWAIFFIQFESKRLPVVVLRRILRAFVPTGRQRDPNRATWPMSDLLFISAFGDEASGQREIAFAHFHEETGGLPTLRVLGWDGADTALKMDHVAAILKERLAWPSDPGDTDAWRQQWSPAFRHRLRHVIRTADALAERLAALARGIRDAATTLMEHESARGPLRRLHKAFQTALIDDLTEADFADTYAQTITYGLLTAAISRTEMSDGRYGTVLTAENVTDMVPITNPFLREMLETFLQAGGRQGGIDFDELGIQDVVELLRGDETDLPAILRDFGNRARGEDPVIYFYEHFLSAYNKALKVQRGVFYTPRPVVSYIVRSVHELLQTEFGLEDGLASTITWGQMAQRHADLNIPDGVGPDSPFVQILDPATGTATFLVEVIDVIHRTLTAKWQQQRLTEEQQRAAWNDYVPNHLLPRLHGYELMMAPYAIAHMKIGLKLYETGYRFGSEERVRVYLTNALEPASDEGKQMAFADWAPALAHEAQAVNTVKREQRFTVVIGNPPYSSISQNMGTYIWKLVNQYLVLPDGPLKEKSNRNHLQDDYVKFIRLSQALIQDAAVGLVAMITNNSYFTGAWYRGMRYHLTTAFPRIYIVDLHGGKGFVRSVAEEDENVFDIMQSVGIGVFVRSLARHGAVSYQELIGRRDEKYRWLLSRNLGSVTAVTPLETNQWLFRPIGTERQPEWNAGVSLEDVFVKWGAGVKTNRNGLAIAFTPKELRSQIESFGDLSKSDETIEALYSFQSNYQWDTGQVRKKFAREGFEQRLVTPYLFRPFDHRHIYWHSFIVFNMRGDKMQAFRSDPAPVALLFSRTTIKDSYTNFFVSRLIADHDCLEKTKVATLFTSNEPTGANPGLGLALPRQPNLSKEFLGALVEKLQLPQAAPFGLPQGLTPEDIFHYTYAVFHSPAYRNRYAEFLKIDFPRLPLAGNLNLFRTLARLGGELVSLHLMESPRLDRHLTAYTGPTHPQVEKVSYAGDTVWLDKAKTHGFRGVPKAIWNFHIGGFQVCQKWLKERGPKKGQPGRTLTPEDIVHYQRIVVAIHETIRLMAEIDEVIEEHGGWPIK